jgi:hypothetical protein
LRGGLAREEELVLESDDVAVVVVVGAAFGPLPEQATSRAAASAASERPFELFRL